MTDEVLIAEHFTSRYVSGPMEGQLISGMEVVATSEAITARCGIEVEGAVDDISVRWAEILKYAPAEALVDELEWRGAKEYRFMPTHRRLLKLDDVPGININRDALAAKYQREARRTKEDEAQ